ncbi:MAG: peptidoglycan-binding protein [Candidatus Liptonbacteria bacterium]|nr:peptidoglycan-binding protein [Candidatus Liptonbacteria bacterium]
MSKTKSKALSAVLSVTTTLWLSGAAALVPVAVSAQTTADLQAQISALLAQIAALQAQLNASSGGSAAVSCNFTRSLTVGSTGDDVMCLQKYLNGAGYQLAASGAGSPGNETSYFGPITRGGVSKWQAANNVTPAVGYFGPISRAKYSALAAVGGVTPGVPPVVVPGTGLSLALASDNPAGATVPKGASAFNVLKFTVSGNGTLNELTFKRQGVGATTDFKSSGIYLYEGANRLTSGKSVNSTTHEVSFVNLNLQVAGTRTLWLAVDTATGATAGNVDYFELMAAVGTPSVSGSLKGNSFTIGGSTAGVATTTKVGSLSSTTVGAKNVQVSEFRLDVSGAEDVEVMSVAMTQGGSISNSNLSNFVLKQNDVAVASASGVGAKDLVTLALSSPLKIEKGQQKTFKLYADIAGSAKSGDTIMMYFDSAADVQAKGKTFGFNVQVDIGGMDTTGETHTVALTGGDVTITFNGPIQSDIALRGQDVQLYNFTIANKNQIEIRNWRFHATTTGLISGEGFNDLKVWDTSNNSVITSAVDITTSTDQTFTDVFTMAAGSSKTFKVTADIDADNDAGDSITMYLLAFQGSDIKNLDNNQFVATTDIVPNSTIAGNTMTVKAPTLDIQLSASPSSQTVVQGSTGKDLVGFSFKATADTIKISTLKITASATSGTLTSGEVTNLALYDGATKVSDVKSLNSSDLTSTFTGLNISVAAGETKTLTVRGNVATDATNNDIFAIKIASTTTDVTATDSDGNTATQTGFGTNSGGTVLVTVSTVGDVTVIKAADDSDTEAGVVLAGGERVLAKFRFTATNELMTVNKLHIMVNSSTSATATTTTTADDSPTLKLYDGTVQIGSVSGYTIQASGASSSIAVVENLGWAIPKDGSKTLTVKSVVPAIGQSGSGADFGTNLYAHVMAAGFEAQGATNKDTTITAASGNQKLVYKVKPTLTVSGSGLDTVGVGSKKVIKFTVAANGDGQVAWKRVQLKISVTNATITAATDSNASIKRVGGSSNLTLASAWTATSATGATSTNSIDTVHSTGYLNLVLSTPEEVAAGSSREYEVQVTVGSVVGGTTPSSISTNLHRAETSAVTGTYGDIGMTSISHDASDSFIWSDYSVAGHDETTADWANSHLVNVLPSDTVTIEN